MPQPFSDEQIALIQRLRQSVLANPFIANNPAVQEHIESIREQQDPELIEATFKKILKILITGSPTLAILVNTLVYFTSVGAVGFIQPIINEMPNLSGVWKSLLTAMAAVGSAGLCPWMGVEMDRNSAIKPLLIIRALSQLGIWGLIAAISVFDLKDMKDFDYRVATMAPMITLAGSSTVTFVLASNGAYWNPVSNAVLVQAIIMGGGNTGLGLVSLALQFTKEALGLQASLGIYSGIFLIANLIAWRYLHKTPLQQLNDMGFSNEEARALAVIFGQEKLPAIANPNSTFVSEFFGTALSLRGAAIAAHTFSSFGGMYSLSTSGYIMLNRYFGVVARWATVINSSGSIFSSFARVAAGKMLARHGLIAYLFATATIATISLVLAQGDVTSLPLLISVIGVMYAAFGVASSTTFAFISSWARPQNPELPQFNIGAMTACSGLTGGISSISLPSLLAAFIAAYGDEGYLKSFYITAGAAALGATVVTATDCYATPSNRSIASQCFSWMRRKPVDRGQTEMLIRERDEDPDVLTASHSARTLNHIVALQQAAVSDGVALEEQHSVTDTAKTFS